MNRREKIKGEIGWFLVKWIVCDAAAVGLLLWSYSEAREESSRMFLIFVAGFFFGSIVGAVVFLRALAAIGKRVPED